MVTFDPHTTSRRFLIEPATHECRRVSRMESCGNVRLHEHRCRKGYHLSALSSQYNISVYNETAPYVSHAREKACQFLCGYECKNVSRTDETCLGSIRERGL